MASSRTALHGRFLWYELMTTDVEGAKAFYADVIGWGLQSVAPDTPYILFTAGGVAVSGLSVMRQDAMDAGFRPGWLGYIGVDDVDMAAHQIEQLGGIMHVPPIEVPGISRFAIAADPQSATFALMKWLNSPGEQPAELEGLGRVGWHELIAADWEKTWSFYRELFGWRKAEADTGDTGVYQRFSVGGVTVGGMFTKPATVPMPFWLYYFNVADIDAAGYRLKAGGGQILEGPLEVPGNRWMIQCRDPQGAIFALVGKRSQKEIGYFERVPRSARDKTSSSG
jgi:uncharacterized protein